MSAESVIFVNPGNGVFCIFDGIKEQITYGGRKLKPIGYVRLIHESDTARARVEWQSKALAETQYFYIKQGEELVFALPTADILPFPARAPHLRAVT